MRTTGTILVMVLGLLVMPVRFAEAGPMETAFTYQGHLYDANYVADGLYDFAFKLYDANSGGSKIGTDVNVGDVDVIDGYFTVELDFNDANAFNGDARWLEIGVRQGDMNDPNVYTTLSPRQEVTPAPYALYAKNSAGDSDWIMSGGDMYSGVSGNVGIGTASPGKKLDVAGHINAADYYFLNDKVLVYNTPGTGNLFYGWDVGIKKHSMATNGVERLVVDDSGNVGIGTTAPTQMLDVDGKARIAGDVYLEGILNLNDSSNTTYIQNVGDGLKFWVDTLGTPIAFDFQCQDDSYMTILNSGEVGIGTTSPRGILDVEGEGDDIYLDTWSAQIYLGDVIGDGDGTLFTVDDDAGKFTFENGDVGIGKTNPTEALDVNGTAKANAFVGDGSGLYNLPAMPDTDWTVSGSDMYSAVAGDVGIGTTSPDGKLEVSHDGSSGDLIVDSATGNVGIGIAPNSSYQLFASSSSDTVTGRFDNWSTGGYSYGVAGYAQGPGGTNHIGVYGYAYNGTNNWAGFFDGDVHAAGDVGIGTESPAGTLEVSHDGSSHDLMVDSSNGFVGIGTDSPTQKLHIEHSVVGSNVVKIVNTAATNSLGLSIETGGTGASAAFRVLSAGSPSFYVNNNGRVGIGAPNPANELGVKGAAAIGASYSITKPAPANGLLVEGSVGIGTYSPARALHVSDVMRLEPRVTAPSSPSEGDIYMNSTTHKLMVYDGTTWQACW